MLDFVEEGKHILSREGVMAGGGANRILIGDPALRPFGQASHPLESVVIKNKKKDGFDIEVEWRGGWHARSWDIYRNHRKGPKIGRARIPVRVDLAGYAPLNKKLQFNCKAEARSNRDELMPYTLTHCVPETFHGRRYLHLQMNSPREAVDRKAVTATFHVTYK